MKRLTLFIIKIVFFSFVLFTILLGLYSIHYGLNPSTSCMMEYTYKLSKGYINSACLYKIIDTDGVYYHVDACNKYQGMQQIKTIGELYLCIPKNTISLWQTYVTLTQCVSDYIYVSLFDLPSNLLKGND